MAVLASSHNDAESVDEEPSQPRPTGTPAERSSATGARPAPSNRFEPAVGDPDAGPPQALDLGPVGVDTVSDPGAVREPADVLVEAPHRPAPIDRLAVVVLVEILGQVRMEPDVETDGELCRFGHEAAADREGRAGRERDAHHRPYGPVVVCSHCRFRPGEYGLLVLAHRARREAPVFFGDAHRTSCGVETHAYLTSCLDLRPQQVTASGWVHIEVVGRCRATPERKLCQANKCRKINGFFVEQGPVWVQYA